MAAKLAGRNFLYNAVYIYSSKFSVITTVTLSPMSLPIFALMSFKTPMM